MSSRWSIDAVGSTRAVGLLRIALALIIWVRYAKELGFHSGVEWWTAPLAMVFYVVTTLMLLGVWTRVSVAATALLLVFFYFGLGVGGVKPGWYGHHAYLLMAATCLLALTPCGKSYSWDRFTAIRRGRQPKEEGPLWGQNLIVLQMVSLYFWTAYDKTGWHFLSGERLEAIFIWAHTNRPFEALLDVPYAAMTAAVMVVVVEYFLAFAILIRRLHWIAVPMGLALHGTFFVILPVNTYSISMMVLYIAVLSPSAVHRFIDQMHGAKV